MPCSACADCATFGNVAVRREQPAADRAAEPEARLEREDDSGEDDRRGAPAILPLGEVRDVGHHRPEQWNRESVGELAQHLDREHADDRRL
jgi:hypothetical protein